MEKVHRGWTWYCRKLLTCWLFRKSHSNSNLPYHTIPYHTIPYHTLLENTRPYHTIPYHTILGHTIPYHTIPYHTIAVSINAMIAARGRSNVSESETYSYDCVKYRCSNVVLIRYNMLECWFKVHAYIAYTCLVTLNRYRTTIHTCIRTYIHDS